MLMMEEEKLIDFHRPNKFGKSTFLSLLGHLYYYGFNSSKLKQSFPHLGIFQNDFLEKNGLSKTRWNLLQKKIEKTTFVLISLDFEKTTIDDFKKDIAKFFWWSMIDNCIEAKTELYDFLRGRYLYYKEHSFHDFERIFDDLQVLSRFQTKVVFLIKSLD